MVSDISRTPTPAGRPRDPALERAILAATVEVVIESGFAAARLEEIARRAHTGKAAIYRRWRSKTELVIAAAESLLAEVVVPDEGSLRQDLLACARHYVSPNTRTALMLATVLAEATHTDELRATALESIGRPPTEALRTVIQRWALRGAVRSSAPVELIVSLIPAIAFHRVLLHHEGLNETIVVSMVDDVLMPALNPGHQ